MDAEKKKRFATFNSLLLFQVAAAATGSCGKAPSERAVVRDDALIAIVFAALAAEALINEVGQCAAEWKETKAAGKTEKGATWPKFWSDCNKRLKAAAK
jgi:hypothetical protein